MWLLTVNEYNVQKLTLKKKKKTHIHTYIYIQRKQRVKVHLRRKGNDTRGLNAQIA